MQYAKIIIVDDDIDDLVILKSSFLDQNFSAVTSFLDGVSLLNYLDGLENESSLPSLIITDINMPKMSGIELLERIKKQKRFQSIKVIMLSTANKQEYMETSKQLGAWEYFQKPSSYLEMKAMASHFTEL